MSIEEKIHWICDLYEAVDSLNDLELIMVNSGFHKGQAWCFKAMHTSAKNKATSPEQRRELFLNELKDVAERVYNAFETSQPNELQ